MIKDNSTILFQGDSITDAERNREDLKDIGSGYPYFVNESLKASNKNIKVINRGISGNRSIDLVNRLQEDFIDIKPNYVSLLIGINDVWRGYDHNDFTLLEDFENNLELILSTIRDKMQAKIILLEPFLIGTDFNSSKMREDLWKKVDVYRKLGYKYADTYISYEGMFAERIDKEVLHWSLDGVHPSTEGHKLIAEKFLKKTGLL